MTLRASATLLFIFCCTPSAFAGASAPTTWLRGGAVWTGDEAHPSAESILVEGDHLVAIGSDKDVAKVVTSKKLKPRVIELRGRRVLPGIIDSHIHIVGGGLQLARVDLNPARTKQQTYDLIKKYATEHPQVPWILGRGWAYDLWKPGLPTRGELDAFLPDRPVFVRAYDGHSGWANSKALAIAGIDEKTPDPKNGKIVREPGSKRPSGALLEDAMDLVWDKMPKPSVDEKRKAIVAAGEHAAQHGVTAMCEVGGDLADLDLFYALDRAHQLPVRVVFGPAIDDGGIDNVTAYAKKRAELFAKPLPGSLLTPGPLKGFVDGVIESGTAHTLAAFGDGGPVVPPHITPATLVDQISRADKLGIDVSYHAIGDAAVRSVLDAVEKVNKANPPRERRPRIEHIEIVDPSDLPRFAALGVIPSQMPLHADPGVEPDGGIYVKKVGPERLPYAFAFHDLRQAGAALIFGSDWPVVTLDPLPAIAMAVTRTREDGRPPGGWVPKQALSMEDTLLAYTTRAAFGTRLEKITGTLKPGLAADLVVLSPEAKLDKPESFFKAKVDLTFVAGRLAYERN